jgi:hypothetical protein
LSERLKGATSTACYASGTTFPPLKRFLQLPHSCSGK